MGLNDPFHLLRFDRTVASGREWRLAVVDWFILQLSEGIAYALDSKENKELPLGGLIICPPKSQLTVTASVLRPAVFRGVAIRLSSLAGLLTAVERECLESEVARRFAPFLTLPAEHLLAQRVTQLFAPGLGQTFSNRLAVAQVFAELVEPPLQEALRQEKEKGKQQEDALGRLRQLLSKIPESELVSLSLEDFARMLECCERHASRLFREECGIGFVSYISNFRVKRATELLMQNNLKIIDVALESGYGSLAHFNYVFKKRFNMTPTQWREKQVAPLARGRSLRAKPLQAAALGVCLLLGAMGITKSAAAEAPASVSTNKPVAVASSPKAPAAKPSLRFQVDRYEVRGNTVLASNIIARVLAPYTGKSVDLDQIKKAVEALQLEYYQRGYVTVKISTPPQQVTNRVIVFEATEGRVTTVKILNNHHFSSNNILATLPYVKTLQSSNRILNSKIFQTELDRANANLDRQIAPEVRPGLEPGTTALVLDVTDRLPLHGRLEFDDYAPPNTPDLRLNGNVTYGNLWQLDHTLGLQYGFSPEREKPSLGDDTHLSLIPLDSPEVSYYSGFYRAPLGAPETIENQIAGDQTHFGYNEVTHQFTLPPPTGRPEFSAYASRSTTAPTLAQPESTVFSTTNQTIAKQLINQQYTTQSTAGARLSFPLPMWADIQSSFSFGADYKDDKVVTLPTNYFYDTTIIRHGTGAGIPPTISETNIAIPEPGTYPYLNYIPLFFGWQGSRQDHWGQFGPPSDLWSRFDGNLSLVLGTGGILSKDKAFPVLIANSPEATTGFMAVRAQITRTEVLPENFTFYDSLSGQWANEPLLNLEQFALGGSSSVRGYREGELYADEGGLETAEIRSPVYWRGLNRRVGTQITAFMDYGQGYELDPSNEPVAHHALWGAGVGLNLNLGPHVEGHVFVAWPLLNGVYTPEGHERVGFSLSAQL